MEIELILQLWNTLGWPGKTVAVLLALHPLASVIVATTHTPLDEKTYAKFYRGILQPLALQMGKRAFEKKETPLK